MMRKAILAVAFILAMGDSIASASITYTLVDYLSDQNGYILSGTITTDGNSGLLTADDFCAADFEIDGTDYSVTSFNIGGGGGWNGLTATGTQLSADAGCYFGMVAAIGDSNAGIYWANLLLNGLPAYWASAPNASWYTQNPAELTAADWVVATVQSVPEPSTAIIWSLLGGLGITLGWFRRKRAT